MLLQRRNNVALQIVAMYIKHLPATLYNNYQKQQFIFNIDAYFLALL